MESERPIDSAFHTIPLEDWVLHMVVSGLARCVSDLSRIYGCAYKAVSCAGHTPAFDRAIDLLCDGKQIRRGEQGELSSTPSGKATACTGLSCGQAVYLLDTMNRQFPESSFGWTALALSVPGIELPPGMLTRLDLADNGPVRMLYQRFDHSVEEVTCLIGKNHRREPLTFQQASALKALLLLDEWSRLKPAQSLEERYQIHLGQMLSLGEAAAHILNAAAGLIEVSDRENQVVDQIRRHAFSLKHGLPSELQALHNHFHRILNRADFAGLRRAGITSLSEMVGMDYEELSEVIKSKPKYMKLKGKIDKIKEEVSMSASQVNSMAMVCAEPESIEIDGSFERERYLVKINGYPVRLTGKSFKYFTKLAWSRQNRDSGWVYKEDIEIGFNQARYLYRMKNEIKAGIDSGWPIIENNRLGYYRLNVPPEKIAINAENLRDHPDCEIRDLVVPETAGSDQLNQATVQ